jgi:ABC-2 type transport system permease protein
MIQSREGIRIKSFPLRLRKYWLTGRTSVQNNLAYAANFLFDTFLYMFLVSIFIQLWRTIFAGGATIAGYSLPQMIWYSIMTELITFSGGSIFHDLNAEIKAGNIAYTLNKPYHYIWYQLANSAGVMLFKLLINGIAAITLGLIFVGPLPDFRWLHLPFILIAILNGLLLNFLILTSLGLTAFWLEENTAFFWIYQKLGFMLGLFLPLEFFPNWLQKIASYLPFPYITYAPAKLAVKFSWDWFTRTMVLQYCMIFGFGAIAFAIYRKGVKLLNVNGG